MEPGVEAAVRDTLNEVHNQPPHIVPSTHDLCTAGIHQYTSASEASARE
jgi:hypothetical protein